MLKRNFITLHRNNQYTRIYTSHQTESQNNPIEHKDRQKEKVEHNIHT